MVDHISLSNTKLNLQNTETNLLSRAQRRGASEVYGAPPKLANTARVRGEQNDDAVKINISRPPSRPDPRKKDATDIRQAGPTRVTDVRPIERPETDGVQPDIEGTYGQGTFVTSNGKEGEYFAREDGQLGFKIGDIEGYIREDGVGIATNTKTGDQYAFEVDAADGKFSITNLQKVDEEPAVIGSYGNGTFITSNGEEGKYFKLDDGNTGFTIGDFEGVVKADGTGYAINEKTGKEYTFEVQAENGKFAITNLQEVEEHEPKPRELDAKLLDKQPGDVEPSPINPTREPNGPRTAPDRISIDKIAAVNLRA